MTISLTLSKGDTATLAAGGSVAVNLTGTSAVVPPDPPSSVTSPIYADGKFAWAGDWSFPAGHVAINYADTTFGPTEGPADAEIITSAPYAGYQPWAPHSAIDLTPYKYLQLDIKPTSDSISWKSGWETKGKAPVADDAAETPIGGVVYLEQYAEGPIGNGVWTRYKIPLGDGGYGIPSGSTVFKVMIQDDTGNANNRFAIQNMILTD